MLARIYSPFSFSRDGAILESTTGMWARRKVTEHYVACVSECVDVRARRIEIGRARHALGEGHIGCGVCTPGPPRSELVSLIEATRKSGLAAELRHRDASILS